jgi:hypothetical protein
LCASLDFRARDRRSDTWSDREIRTLLTRIFDLPLTLSSIKSFEAMVADCAANLTAVRTPATTPPFERYFDSDLPVVSSDLVTTEIIFIQGISDTVPSF